MNKHSVFMDVGSGNGKAVYQIALYAECLAIGMEVFGKRYNLSRKMMDLDNYYIHFRD